MGKAKRKVKPSGKVKVAPKKKNPKTKSGAPWQSKDDDSDDYSNKADKGSDLFNDEVDQFCNERVKVLLDRGKENHLEPADSSSEEEVLPLVSDGEDSDPEVEMYKQQLRRLRAEGFRKKISSDIEDEEEGSEDDGQKAWGQARKAFYGGNIDEMKQIDYDNEDADAAVMEEKEVVEMQRRLAAEMNDDDFGLDIFKSVKKSTTSDHDDTEDKVNVSRDLSRMTRKQKIALLKKESPELTELVADFRTRLSEVNDMLVPISDTIKLMKIAPNAATDYVETRLQLTMGYCVNIGFYLALKARRVSVDGHPVITRLVQFRKLLKQLDDIEWKVKPHIEDFIQRIRSGRLESLSVAPRNKDLKQKGRDSPMESGDDDDEEEVLEDEAEGEEMPRGGSSKRRRLRKPHIVDGEEFNEDEAREETGDAVDGAEENGEAMGDARRKITYDIAKNKGLTARKKKEYRNPRVKHRLKFRKAKIRRRGQVREVRTELTKYGGEISGIRAGVKKSRRLK